MKLIVLILQKEEQIMLWLQYGDKLPAVACVQYLLGFTPQEADCCYGSLTKKAVTDFQKLHNKIDLPRLREDGIVGPKTWKALNKYKKFTILNIEDTSNPRDSAMKDEIKYFSKHSKYTYYTKKFENVFPWIGGGALHIYKRKLPILILRISGHGSQATQGLSDSKYQHWYWLSKAKNSCVSPYKLAESSKGRKYCNIQEKGIDLSMNNIEYAMRWLKNIKNVFSPFGSIELHGCNVAKGQKGELFIKKLSMELGMPVTAGKSMQYAYSVKSILRFEGRTYTYYPNGSKTWAAQAVLKQWNLDLGLTKRKQVTKADLMKS